MWGGLVRMLISFVASWEWLNFHVPTRWFLQNLPLSISLLYMWCCEGSRASACQKAQEGLARNKQSGTTKQKYNQKWLEGNKKRIHLMKPGKKTEAVKQKTGNTRDWTKDRLSHLMCRSSRMRPRWSTLGWKNHWRSKQGWRDREEEQQPLRFTRKTVSSLLSYLRLF